MSKPLPDDAPDHMALHDESIENLLHRADGPAILTEREQREQHIADLEEFHRKRDVWQGEVDVEEMNEYLQNHSDAEIDNFIYSEAGKQYTLRKLAEDGRQEMAGQQGRTSEQTYQETYRQRLQREAREKEAKE